ncbi:MAG: exosortase A [Gammaproteobacteria bacterium]
MNSIPFPMLNRRDSLSPMVCSTAVLAAVLVLYWTTVFSTVRVWWSSATYGSAFLILPVSVYLIWIRRHFIAALTPVPQPLGLLLLVPLVALWWAAHVSNVNGVQALALVLILPALMWTLLGNRLIGEMGFPLAYLLLTVPVWDVLIPPLRDLTTIAARGLLELLGVPVLREGYYLRVPEGQFLVAPDCAGLRYLHAAMTLSALFAYLSFRELRRVLIFVAVAMLVSIVTNWLRVVTVILIGHIAGMGHPLVNHHANLGWALFWITFIPLLWFGAHLKRIELTPGHPIAAKLPADRSAKPAMVPMVAAALLVLALGPAGAAWVENRPLAEVAAVPAAILPTGSWTGPEPLDGNWQPVFAGAAAERLYTYSRQGRRVALYMGYYVQERPGAELISERNTVYQPDQWKVATEEVVTIELAAARPIRVRETQIYNQTGGSRLVWHWYYAGGRFTGDHRLAKLLQVCGLLTERETSAAIALSTDSGPDPQEARTVMQGFLADFGRALGAAVAGAVSR